MQVKKIPQRILDVKKIGFLVFEFEHISKNEKIIPVMINARMNTYEGKLYILSIARDITERKKLNRELRDTDNFNAALSLLNKNLQLGAKDAKTFDLLIEIYKKMHNYSDLIKILNVAIKNAPRKIKSMGRLKKKSYLRRS